MVILATLTTCSYMYNLPNKNLYKPTAGNCLSSICMKYKKFIIDVKYTKNLAKLCLKSLNFNTNTNTKEYNLILV